jgi:glutamine---fructose-6-phosphate transaminase (isomerizing)
MLRLAQVAVALGARLGDLDAVPGAVARVLEAPGPVVDPPQRLLELVGAGPAAERTEAIAAAMEVTGARVVRLRERDLGEPLSVFALTVWVQRIALELAEARGVSPDRFRYEEDPRRERAIESLGF